MSPPRKPPSTPPRHRPGIDTPHSPAPPSTSSPYGPGFSAYITAGHAAIDLDEALSQLAHLVPGRIMDKHALPGEELPYVRRIAAAATEYIRALRAEKEEVVERAARERREAVKRLVGLVWGTVGEEGLEEGGEGELWS